MKKLLFLIVFVVAMLVGCTPQESDGYQYKVTVTNSETKKEKVFYCESYIDFSDEENTSYTLYDKDGKTVAEVAGDIAIDIERVEGGF